MSNMDKTMDYNWDNIMVGDSELNHSNQFFEKRRDAKAILGLHADKENNPNDMNKTISTKDLLKIVSAKSKDRVKEPPIASEIEPLVESMKALGHSDENHTLAPAKQTPPPPTQPPKQHPPNLMTKKTAAPQPRSVHDSAAPSAYKYAEIYRKKLARKEERRREEEREARKFKPRPLPDFKKSHQLMEKKREELHHMPVCPETPPTLRRSIEAAARRKLLQEERLLAEKVPDFKARSAEVLTSRPFKPVISHREIEANPFDLRATDRGLERKLYDDAYAKAQEAKRLQEQQEAEEKELLIRQQIRKQKEFKARPNPFSN